MQHLDELNFLIDQAKAMVGTDAQVAKAIGASRQNIHNWRKGNQTCPPKQQALIAAVAGLDALQVLARATVQAEEGSELGDRLMRALGKGLRATGAALGFVGAGVLAIYSLTPTQATAKAVSDARTDNVHKRNRGYVKRRLRGA